jgi:hypothetical protein
LNPSANRVVNSIQRASEQAPNAIIDGRDAGLSKGTAAEALREWMASALFASEKPVTIYTKDGRVQYVPGKGLVLK